MLKTDRCDRCGVQAYTGWWRAEAHGELLWCAHHDREHADALEAKGWTRLVDDRDQLARTREPELA